MISDEVRVKYFTVFCEEVLNALLHFDWQNVVGVNIEQTRLMNVELDWFEFRRCRGRGLR